MREKEQTCIKMKHIGSFFNVDLKMEINCGGTEEAVVKEWTINDYSLTAVFLLHGKEKLGSEVYKNVFLVQPENFNMSITG